MVALLSELSGGARRFVRDELLSAAHARLEDRSHFFAFIARDHADNALGVITVTAGAAIYANGIVGTIQELYVVPPRGPPPWERRYSERSSSSGKGHAGNRLEVGAPPQSRWQRTIDFYKRNGFGEIGPRLQKRLTVE
jgi:hypothetical protein